MGGQHAEQAQNGSRCRRDVHKRRDDVLALSSEEFIARQQMKHAKLDESENVGADGSCGVMAGYGSSSRETENTGTAC